MFRWTRARRASKARYAIRSVAGDAVLVVERDGALIGEHRVADLVLIRRVRALELTDDRWELVFRPEGWVTETGKQGARLATLLQRERPGMTVQVHYPDDD